jgi:hypothetical protein
MAIVFNNSFTLNGNTGLRLTIGKLPRPDSPYLALDNLTTQLKNNMASLRNPNFYDYRLDGDGYYISDGGDDMYDSGNYTLPWLLSGTDYSQDNGDPGDTSIEINYDTVGTQLIDTDFYYQSLGYFQFNGGSQDNSCLPLTVLGTRSGVGNPIGFQVCGNSGSDGGGTLSSGVLYSGSTLNGFTVHAFYRETYDAYDPSHCNLYILLGHPNWGSTFGSVYSYADPTSNGGCGGYFYTSGGSVKNILAIQTLLSKQYGVEVTSAECQTVVQSYTSLLSAVV